MLVTDGAACLQREKLERSGLAAHFDAVVGSGDLGIGKPDPASSGTRCRERDIDAALALGLRAVWINRSGHARPREDLDEITCLDELAAPL